MSLFSKPRVIEKLRFFHKRVQENNGKIGTALRGIDLNFNNRCNFKCEHCFTNSSLNDHPKEELPLDMVESIANQADELGIFEFDLQGGELLINPEKLYEVIKRIKPERFYLYLTTNGFFLTKKVAKELALLGVSRVSVSIDGFDPSLHDFFRGVKGAHIKALKALQYVKKAGIDPYLNITVGHYNAFDENTFRLISYSKERGYTTLLNAAVPSGRWQNCTDIMLDNTDRNKLLEYRKIYKNILRDIWNPFDSNYKGILGCNTINRTYITPVGDVLVCPYVHIKIGNIFNTPLKEIIDYGFSWDIFREHSDLCLAGEDKNFVMKYMDKEGMSIFNPILMESL